MLIAFYFLTRSLVLQSAPRLELLSAEFQDIGINDQMMQDLAQSFKLGSTASSF